MRIKRLLGCEESSAAAQGAAAVVLALLVVSAVSIGSSARAQTKAEVQVTSAVVTVEPVVKVSTVTTQQVKPIVKVHVISAPVVVAEVRPQVAGAGPSQGVSGGVAQGPRQGTGMGVGQGIGAPKVSGGVMAGQIESKVNPVYPEEAKAAGVQGAVVLKALINKTGDVENLQVISGPRELMASAIDAVRQWKYKPFLLNGEPTEVETTITVNYHLAGADGAPMAREEGPDAAGLVAKPMGPGITPPVVVSTAMPEYTPEARAKKLSGTVLVHLWVDEQGNPIHVQVARGLGNELDQQAIAAVAQYTFAPATENGKPVVVAMNTEINFQIF